MNRLENGVRKALRGAVDHPQGLDTGGKRRVCRADDMT